jgi:hypothetical protein
MEDYPFRVEKMDPHGEIGRVLVYKAPSLHFEPPSSNTPTHAFACATRHW